MQVVLLNTGGLLSACCARSSHMGPAWVCRAVCQLASCHQHVLHLCCRGPPFILGEPQNEGGPDLGRSAYPHGGIGRAARVAGLLIVAETRAAPDDLAGGSPVSSASGISPWPRMSFGSWACMAASTGPFPPPWAAAGDEGFLQHSREGDQRWSTARTEGWYSVGALWVSLQGAWGCHLALGAPGPPCSTHSTCTALGNCSIAILVTAGLVWQWLLPSRACVLSPPICWPTWAHSTFG